MAQANTLEAKETVKAPGAESPRSLLSVLPYTESSAPLEKPPQTPVRVEFPMKPHR